jgi:PLP dependent protein
MAEPNPYRNLSENLTIAREEIARAAERSGRGPEEVRLIAVTKGHPAQVVHEALDAGLTDLAENRVEALEERLREVGVGRCRWHMVGRLQRRQAPALRGRVDLLHSLDSVRLAERLERTWEDGEPILPVLIQVNASGEGSKTGFTPEDVMEGAGRILEMKSLRPLGLMTMAPFTEDEGVVRDSFRILRGVRERLEAELPSWEGRELSMGMSNDFTLAVEEGSTMVRLGTALFGERRR